jgi:hypothetical protein
MNQYCPDAWQTYPEPGYFVIIEIQLEECLIKRFMLVIGLAFLSLSLVIGCGTREKPAKGQESGADHRTLTKEPVKDEPAKEENKNRIYDEPNMPIRTEYPDTMKMASGCSDEGCGFTFTFESQDKDQVKAKIHIFLPRGAATAAAQEAFVIGPHGLLASNGWKKESDSCDTGIFPVSWVRKVIGFSDPKNLEMVGKILLGETSGQAVQVTLYYQSDLGDEFFPTARSILEKLHFKSDKLPIGKR